MKVWAVIVGAGGGARFGGPKQFELLAGKPLIGWCLDSARASSEGVALVVPEQMTAGLDALDADVVVPGGATRADSVRAGIAVVPVSAEIIVVHDAARPLASPRLFATVIEEVAAGADAAIPGIAPVDTVKTTTGDLVASTLDRGSLICAQTPQAFRAALLRKAHAGDPDAPDDAALVEAIGATVHVVPGEVRNLKITRREDLLMADVLARA